jgi:hypothetical protein
VGFILWQNVWMGKIGESCAQRTVLYHLEPKWPPAFILAIRQSGVELRSHLSATKGHASAVYHEAEL